jgi:hypothetical protein
MEIQKKTSGKEARKNILAIKKGNEILKEIFDSDKN